METKMLATIPQPTQLKSVVKSTTELTSYTSATSDAQIMAMWLHGKAKSTQSTYTTSIKQFISYVGLGLKDLRVDHLQDYQVYLESRYSSAYTVKTKLQAIKSLLTFAHKLGYLTVNVGRLIKTSKPGQGRNERILSQTEIEKLLAAATTPRDNALVSLLFYCGLRVSEVINLAQDDISRVGDRHILKILGKGAKERFIPLPQKVLAALKALPADTHYLTPNYKGDKLTRQGVGKILKGLAAVAGINPNMSPHWLRHTHATLSLANGCDLTLLSKSLGHASISTTGIYLHTNPEKSSADYL